MKTFFVIIFIFLLLSTVVASDMNRVRWHWTKPTYGTPVVYYIFQLSTDAGPFETITTVPDTSLTIDMEVYKTYIARVAGVDAQEQQGNWSRHSEPYYAEPIKPGQPTNITFEEMLNQ